MPTHQEFQKVIRCQQDFNISRAEAIDAYANLERSLFFLLTVMLGGNQYNTGMILSRMVNTRSRNTVIQKIVDKSTNKKYRLFTNSVFKLVAEVDISRNHLVHWHMTGVGVVEKNLDDDTYFALTPPGPIDGDLTRLYKSDMDDFYYKVNFLAIEISEFESFLNPENHISKSWPQTWRDRFLQPLEYPPEPDHPQFRTYKVRPAPVAASSG